MKQKEARYCVDKILLSRENYFSRILVEKKKLPEKKKLDEEIEAFYPFITVTYEIVFIFVFHVGPDKSVIDSPYISPWTMLIIIETLLIYYLIKKLLT